ncbi:hypothetical protein D9M68_987550 [compost metagenome]
MGVNWQVHLGRSGNAVAVGHVILKYCIITKLMPGLSDYLAVTILRSATVLIYHVENDSAKFCVIVRSWQSGIAPHGIVVFVELIHVFVN